MAKKKRRKKGSLSANVSESNSLVNNNNELSAYSFGNATANSMTVIRNALFGTDIFKRFDRQEVQWVIENPIRHYKLSAEISEYVYNKNGIVSGAIDYMCALPRLDKVITYNADEPNRNAKKNKTIMRSVLKTIDDKHFIRDALHTEMIYGAYFYYFETKNTPGDHSKLMNDYDVNTIVELNEYGINASIITLPWKYCKIIGRKNGRNVVAMDLRYFDEIGNPKVKARQLRIFPQEISSAYYMMHKNKNGGNNWLVLDVNKTMCNKIKARDSEAWGRPLAISALDDILYKEDFVNTKRTVLDNINHQVFVHEYPEGERKGSCSLNRAGQEDQHRTVRDAVLNKDNQKGTSFVSVAAGTKLSQIKIDTADIFDESNESNLNEDIAVDLGICASLLGAMSSGSNYSAQVNNLELVTTQVYAFIEDIQRDLNYVINKNILHSNAKSEVNVYYLPTSFVNSEKFFSQMMQLYTNCGGSLSFAVASTGVDPDIYLSVLKNETADGLYDFIKPHPTSYTMSASEEAADANAESGRPELDDPTNEYTIKTRDSGGNNAPKPSTN